MRYMNWIIVVLMLTLVRPVTVMASALPPTSCLVKVEIVGVGDGKPGSASLKLKVVGILDGTECPVAAGRTYWAPDNYPGALKQGDVIRADVGRGSSMGPGGAVPFLYWSSLTRVDGGPIVDKHRVRMESLQSDVQPH